MTVRATIELSGGKAVPVALDLPPPGKCHSKVAAVVLGHGAGGDMDSGNLPKHAQNFAAAGLPCVRYSVKGSNLGARVKCCEGVMEHASKTFPQLKEVTLWVAAGHSMGARVASAIADAHPARTVACVFFSYPFHPPGAQDKVRDLPLTKLRQPLLFVRGTKDAFSAEGPTQAILKRMEATDVQVHTVEGGDHSLKVTGKGSAAATGQALEEAAKAVADFVAKVAESAAVGAYAGPGDADAHEPADAKAASNKRQQSTVKAKGGVRKPKVQTARKAPAAKAKRSAKGKS